MSYYVCSECGKKEFLIDMDREVIECASCHRTHPIKALIGVGAKPTLESANDKSSGVFVVKDGVLEKYLGEKTEIVIPEGITEIADDCFREKITIEKITLPSTLATIGEYAFSKCKGLTQMDIPDSVKVIKTGAFAGCSSLKKVNIPEGTEVQGDSVFFGCSSLIR